MKINLFLIFIIMPLSFPNSNNVIFFTNPELNMSTDKGQMEENNVINHWNKTFGGRGDQNVESIIESSDGGFILAGSTKPLPIASSDILLIKIDYEGNYLWNRTFGRFNRDDASNVLETSDGGYLVAGYVEKESRSGSGNIWLIKTNSTGHQIWEKDFGGIKAEMVEDLIQTSEDEFLVVGSTSSFRFDSDSLFELWDIYIIKVDSNGSFIWHKTYGFPFSSEYGVRAIETSDGGFILVGNTNSQFQKDFDVWISKLSKYGELVWTHFYGKEKTDLAVDLIQTSDKNYLLGGWTNSFSHNSSDIWLLKFDEMGNEIWNKTIGGPKNERLKSLIKTSDNGFLLAGWIENRAVSISDTDILIIKTDEAGNQLWNQTFGGLEDDYASILIPTSDGQYLLGASTESFGSLIDQDIWLIKFSNITESDFVVEIILISGFLLILSILIIWKKYKNGVI